MSRIYLLFGPNFTGKTSFALGEDEEDKVDYYEFESGGYRRASPSIRNPERITIHKFRAPLADLNDLGTVSVGERGGTAPSAVYNLNGWLETYQDFRKTYRKNLKDGTARPVLDTATRLWLIVRNGWQQQLQDATKNDEARLDQLKYTEPNARMMQIAEEPEYFDRDLVLIAHEDTVFNSNPPVYKPDTFKELPNVADVTLRFKVVGGKPIATIFKMGEGGLDLIDMEIPEPSLKKVNLLLDCAAALRRAGLAMPKTSKEVIDLGSSLL